MKMRAGVVGLLLCACTQPATTQTEDVACAQETRVAEVDLGDGEDTSVAFAGAVRLLERENRQAGSTQGTAGASFYDVRQFFTEYPNPTELSPTCVGITGVPSQSGSRTALAVSGVRLEGVQGGPVDLAQQAGGALSYGPVSQLFTSAPVTVTIQGSSTGFGSVTFPPLQPPVRPAVSSPDLSGNFHVGDGELTLKWEPSGAASVSIDLVVAPAGGARAVVSCVVKDDGCHKLDSALITWLQAGRQEPMSVYVRRSVSQTATVTTSMDGGMAASLGLTAETMGKVLP